jgi:hypothetical protein
MVAPAVAGVILVPRDGARTKYGTAGEASERPQMMTAAMCPAAA